MFVNDTMMLVLNHPPGQHLHHVHRPSPASCTVISTGQWMPDYTGHVSTILAFLIRSLPNDDYSRFDAAETTTTTAIRATTRTATGEVYEKKNIETLSKAPIGKNKKDYECQRFDPRIINASNGKYGLLILYDMELSAE